MNGTPIFIDMPAMPVVTQPVALDPDTFIPRTILTRYGKKLLAQGAKYYSKITIDNFSDEPAVKPKKKCRSIDAEWEVD